MKFSKTLKQFTSITIFSLGLQIAFPTVFLTAVHAGKPRAELAPLPEAKPLLIEVAKTIESDELKKAIKDSPLLMMMRERMKTTLYHLNFKFEITVENYPYDPPFLEPFPFRPTLEALEEVKAFFIILNKSVGFQTALIKKINDFPYYQELRESFSKLKPQTLPKAISKSEALANTSDTYETMSDRRLEFGEIASFPEFETSVNYCLQELANEEIQTLRKTNSVFELAYLDAIKDLEAVKQNYGKATRLQAEFNVPYPYRRTIQALEKAVMVFDFRERLKYPEVINWHEVEFSWHKGNAPKVLPLYHYNRYKYQQFGLLAEPEFVIWPFSSNISTQDLIVIRSAPIGIMDVAAYTSRLDRHFNTPLDNLHHDNNHNRRMWGYDQRKFEKRGAKTRKQKLVIIREQETFVKSLLPQIQKSPDVIDAENELRNQVKILVFETFHETALSPDKESLLQDLNRTPEPIILQPFEVQYQEKVENLEDIRTFDGNLKSGADQLGLNLERPTIIRYFYDRAPGFLANVDNKLRWGFFDSVFKMKKYITTGRFRTPIGLAKAAERLYTLLGSQAPSLSKMVKDINNHGGQPELWNYFGKNDAKLIKVTGLDFLNMVTAEEIQANWRRQAPYLNRWKPTNAKLANGSFVDNERSLSQYFEEKKIPPYLQGYYRLGNDPVTGVVVLFEDIRNLPNEYLASNHQNENLMSGAKAVTAIDRIWQNALSFKTIDDAERWIIVASQFVHQGVLDRNANGSRNNPVYNQLWINLPAQNKMNDLDLVKIAFDARLIKGAKKIPEEQVTLFREAIFRLYAKIKNDLPLRPCGKILGSVS